MSDEKPNLSKEYAEIKQNVLQESNPQDLSQILAQIKMEKITPELLYALEQGLNFPPLEQPLPLETMDMLAAQMIPLGERLIQLALNTAQTPHSVQELYWSGALIRAALRACKWDDAAQSAALTRAFIELECELLPLYYAGELLKEDNLFLLPAQSRFGWYCVKAFAVKESENFSEFIALLHKALDALPEMQNMIAFLIDQAEAEKKRAALKFAPEAETLTELVETLLPTYLPDDPALAALKNSALYQQAACLSENALSSQSTGNAETAISLSSGSKNIFKQYAGKRLPTVIDLQFRQLLKACAEMGENKLFNLLKTSFRKLNPQLQKQYADYLNRYPLWGSFKPEEGDFSMFAEKVASIIQHQDDYIWLYEQLADHRSKKLLFAIVNHWMQFDFTTLNNCVEHCFVDYFDPDIISCSADEVVVDLGAFVGDTVISYVNTYNINSYRRYYCYEISPTSMKELKKNTDKLPNIIYRQKGVGAGAGTMYLNSGSDSSANSLSADGNMPVEVVSLDEDITEPITLLKMDIEGAEQSALQGAARHIQEDHPKLAISVYHNNEDIWRIPRIVDSLFPRYRFYLRYHGGNLWPTEITLLAVPF